MKMQEIFDKSAHHMLLHEKYSKQSITNSYKNKMTGYKCALGIFIPDEHICLENHNHVSIGRILKSYDDLPLIFGINTSNINMSKKYKLLSDLQSLHDDPQLRSQWKDGLIKIAHKYNLNNSIIHEDIIVDLRQ